MKIIDVSQGSPEWHKVRCGVPSASNFDKIVTTKGEPSKQRTKYLHQLAGERIIGITEVGLQNMAMIRGCELEAEARDLYQMITGEQVAQVGFCLADDGYGASPDGLVGEKGLIELKCPGIATHVEYLLGNTLPVEYFQQVQGQLLVTGREWVDFVSYYPAMKPFIIRVVRDNAFLTALERELKSFCLDLENTVKKLKEEYAE